MKLYIHRLLIIAIITLIAISQNQAFCQKRIYNTSKITTQPPRIDGVLDDSIWSAVEWSGDFIQREPYEGKTPSQQTELKIIYDNNNLYIAIRAFDSSPDSIIERLSRRDDYIGDWVAIHIDSYHDKRTGFVFAINAAGVKCDEKVTNDNDWDDSWDAIWDAKVNIDNLGWSSEMQIPLTQLRFGKKEVYTWGVQVVRHLFRKEEYSVWEFVSPNASGWVHHFGELHGINNIEPKKRKEIIPYIVGKMEFYEKDQDNPYADGKDFNASVGLDGKFGITNDITLDFTINPDFGQVEADPSEVNLSTFETFFPEKRAFFIEGNNIFDFGFTSGGHMHRDNLFYSRRIGRKPRLWPETDDNYDEYVKMPKNTNILGAFKLTGKTQKGVSIGIMENVTQKEWAQIAREIPNGEGRNYEYRKEIAEPLTNYFAASLEKDLNNSNTQIGALVTATNRRLETEILRDEFHKAAYTAGVNFNHQWKDKTYYVKFSLAASQLVGSTTDITSTQRNAPHFMQRPDADHLSVDSSCTELPGTGGTFEIGKAGNGKWRGLYWLTFRSPGFNLNDMGYLRGSDEVQHVVWTQYRQNQPKSFYRFWVINFNYWYATTTGLEYLYNGGNVNSYLQFKNYWGTGMGISVDRKSYSTTTLRGGPSLLFDPTIYYFANVGSDGRKKLELNFGVNGHLRQGGTGRKNSYWFEINWRVFDALKISLEPEYMRDYNEVEYVSNPETYQNNDVRYVRGTINREETSLTLRFTYNIGPDFTLQYYGMPFISSGKYKNFKQITQPGAEDFHNRFTTYSDQQITFNESENIYFIDETNDNQADYEFDNPDFNIKDFNSNLVLRWEYRPGSFLYVVWNQKRFDDKIDGSPSFPNDTKDLFKNTYPHDIFLVKLTYRFGV